MSDSQDGVAEDAQSAQQQEKIIQTNEDSLRSFWTLSSITMFHHWGTRRRRERARN